MKRLRRVIRKLFQMPVSRIKFPRSVGILPVQYTRFQTSHVQNFNARFGKKNEHSSRSVTCIAQPEAPIGFPLHWGNSEKLRCNGNVTCAFWGQHFRGSCLKNYLKNKKQTNKQKQKGKTVHFPLPSVGRLHQPLPLPRPFSRPPQTIDF